MPLDARTEDGAEARDRKPGKGGPNKRRQEKQASKQAKERGEGQKAERAEDTGEKPVKAKKRRRRRRNKHKDASNRGLPPGRQSARGDGSPPASTEKTNVNTARDGNRPDRKPGKKPSAVYSAIDLGTNNCRLLIAKQTRGGFRVIDAFSRIVRLGEGVAQDNRLSEDAMDRTIEALKVCAEKLARRNVTCMRHVATEACRIADNSDEFVARVKRETGINLDVISAGEEARLAVLGCQSLIAPDKRNALVFDIGGGSTELIWVKVRPGRRNEIMGWMSVPWGVVNLTERFAKPGKTPKPKKYRRMIETMDEHLHAFEEAHQLRRQLKGRHTQFLGTSGTVTTLASLHLGLPRYIRDRVDGAWMKSKDIHALSRRVAEMSPQERAAEPCIGAERADLVVAGCAILESILGMWQVPSLRVADRGIREGILRGLMQIDEAPRHARSRRGGKPRAGQTTDMQGAG